MNGERKSRNLIIGLLFAIIVFMGVGFATLYSDLQITGSATLSNTWNVQITDISVENKTETANAGTPTANSTTADFAAVLEKPGDYVTYKVTVTNAGSIDAVLTSVSEGFANQDTDSIEYVLSSDNPKATAKLTSGSTHTFIVTATYKSSATGENAPTEEEKTKQFSLQLTYNQDLTSE